MSNLPTLHLPTRFGTFAIKGSELGIRQVNLVDKAGQDSPDIPQLLYDCAQQLQEYFQRKRKEFDLQLDWSDQPDFHRAVWTQLLKIPYGRTTSYSAIANDLGNPKSVRAVGQANRNNPIAIIVPCHRVVARSGELHGYFYGLDMKRQLLELENPMSYGEQGSLF